MAKVPQGWNLDRERAAFLLALAEVAPEAIDWLRQELKNLYSAGGDRDDSALRLLAERWCREWRLMDRNNPSLPAGWAADAAFFNLLRWREELEAANADDDEDFAELLKAVGAPAVATSQAPPKPEFAFTVPWFEEGEDRPVAWDVGPLPRVGYIPEREPRESREAAIARITKDFRSWLEEFLQRQESHWETERRTRRPKPGAASTDDPARHRRWLAKYLTSRMTWGGVVDAFADEKGLDEGTVRRSATRLAKRIGLAVPQHRRGQR